MGFVYDRDPFAYKSLNLNNNTLYLLSLVLMFSDKVFFHIDLRLRMYKPCY